MEVTPKIEHEQNRRAKASCRNSYPRLCITSHWGTAPTRLAPVATLRELTLITGCQRGKHWSWVNWWVIWYVTESQKWTATGLQANSELAINDNGKEIPVQREV